MGKSKGFILAGSITMLACSILMIIASMLQQRSNPWEDNNFPMVLLLLALVGILIGSVLQIIGVARLAANVDGIAERIVGGLPFGVPSVGAPSAPTASYPTPMAPPVGGGADYGMAMPPAGDHQFPGQGQ